MSTPWKWHNIQHEIGYNYDIQKFDKLIQITIFTFHLQETNVTKFFGMLQLQPT